MADKKKLFPERVHVFIDKDEPDYEDDPYLSATAKPEEVEWEDGDLVAIYELREIKKVKVKTEFTTVPKVTPKTRDAKLAATKEALGL